ncbi:MAG: nucleoid-associated protein [Chitinophagales bacterium]|nr:nucleoid-associated protein [Chitinophagales bacterium]
MRADFSDTVIDGLATHYVGNKHSDDTFFYAEELVAIEDNELEEQLLHYFTAPFRDIEEYYRFHHESDINLNTVMHFAQKVFEDPATLLEHSVNIAKHLYEISDSPNIKSGELHITYLSGIHMNGQSIEAIGIYKTEHRDVFINLDKKFSGYQINMQEGIHVDKMDKGCIIYNTNDGIILSAIDKTNKKNEAQYWKDKFLKIIATADEYHYTTDYLTATKEFITKQIPQEYEVTKAQQVDYLNKSINFFKNNNEFDERAFASEVFEDKELINSFSSYKRDYEQQYEKELGTDFAISEYAVKRSARVFKSVIKLDKNFHVYVHGDRDLIEKGYDEAVGKHYYKIYFDNET